jgi:voltage-gated potassium channel Kch
MLSGATPLVALLAARAPRRWIHIAVAILMTAVFGSVVEASLTEPNGSPVAVALLAAVLLCCIPITLLRLLEHETVTGETVAGSLCVYLLLGMAFANVYMAVGLMGGQIIIGTVPTVGAIERADYFYFSFISMLTVGFGDIVPVGRAGQALVVLQAITGQVVLLTLVARMVNVARVRRRPSRRSATGASHAEADVPAAGQTEGGKAH